MTNIHQLFQSEDGNQQQREQLVHYIEEILTSMDSLKDPSKTTLGPMQERSENFYKELMEEHDVPTNGTGLDTVVDALTGLMKGHPFHTHNFITNVLPMASIPGILGLFVNSLLNGNNLWDVYGPAATESEVKVISMMSKLVGYDYTKSFGYTTWGGQGAVFSGLRVAIAKQFPHAKEEGVPNNLYCFASENAHYSLLKSIEAVGIGSNHLIRVKAGQDHSMDIDDLRKRLTEVVENGGIPVYIVATTGATDSFAIDDIKEIKEVTATIENRYNLKPIHIHADSALGGFYAFFNDYDFGKNPLHFEDAVLESLMVIRSRMQYLSLADSLCFDFQKLGQTPYLTSLFLVKDGSALGLLDLEDFDTPYVGNRGYGSYHTGYTLECSRMGSSIAIYAALVAFGKTGYQKILANYVRVNLAFRQQLAQKLSSVDVVNETNIGPITAFRLYPNEYNWRDEQAGCYKVSEIEMINTLNSSLFEVLGKHRGDVFFGDTTRICTVDASDSTNRIPVGVAKFFSISPYTDVKHIPAIIDSLKHSIKELEETNRESCQI
ncbi:pyridoxal phosphate-dependent decarboxylase family protein [Rummeliibacillus suwonensis]|uniref:pyridoxal phosphate-dependent decarboxylase family protein n=1 Tax=Rummeliibacillus suwonensis TaxID=1306154 RepID=UPI001AAF9A3D|nr:pyridoxal-dependent decarboxylase [Rummeliibacillus suwonensis]MBO2536048.1 aspartate aminotransferase family protein [Rummeliibacillus suwonensis]